MKLGKLLAAGKSIMKGRTEISYRSSKQIYLPKFGSAKNPFKPGDSEQSAETTPSPAPAVATEPRASTSGSTTGPEPARLQISAATASGRDGNKPAPPALPGSHPASLGARPLKLSVNNSPNGLWNPQPQKPLAAPKHGAAGSENASTLQRFNSFICTALGKARPSDKSAKNQRATATQTELSLDSVKVVHNDLSDVDVEVVPIKSRSAPPELPEPKKSWEYVGERLFGVEAT